MKYKLIKGSYSDFKSINGLKNKKNVKLLVCKIKDLFETVTGNTPSLNNDIFWSSYKGVKWISTPDFKYQKNGYISANSRFLTEEGVKKSRLCPKDTLLVSCIATIGEVGLIKEPSCFNQQINAILPNSKFNSKYLRYYFLANKQDFINYAPLSVVKIINKKMFNDFEICIHKDLKEQSSIVYILEKQESIISNIEKLISKTEKMFEYFCNREFDLKDIEKSDYQIKDIIIKNPKSTIKAGDIKVSTGNIPAFNSSAKLQYFYDDYLVDGENIFLPTGGSASIHYYNGKSCYTTDVFSFKTEEEKVINKYMYYYFKNDLSILNNMFYGAGLKHLNKNELLNYKIFIPNIEKQKETVELLEKQERLIENQKKLLEKEKQKFEWLSEKLLSGEYLVVDKQE